MCSGMCYLDERVSGLGSADEGQDVDLAGGHDGRHGLPPLACPTHELESALAPWPTLTRVGLRTLTRVGLRTAPPRTHLHCPFFIHIIHIHHLNHILFSPQSYSIFSACLAYHFGLYFEVTHC